MSDSWMAFQPAIEEPSNMMPSAKVSSSTVLMSTVTCCHLPRGSVKRKSTYFTSLSLINFRTSLAVVIVRLPPFLVLSSRTSRTRALKTPPRCLLTTRLRYCLVATNGARLCCHKMKRLNVAAFACFRPFPHGYFRLLATVRSAENLATNAAPHQADPKPLGLMAEIFPLLSVGF